MALCRKTATLSPAAAETRGSKQYVGEAQGCGRALLKHNWAVWKNKNGGNVEASWGSRRCLHLQAVEC